MEKKRKGSRVAFYTPWDTLKRHDIFLFPVYQRVFCFCQVYIQKPQNRFFPKWNIDFGKKQMGVSIKLFAICSYIYVSYCAQFLANKIIMKIQYTQTVYSFLVERKKLSYSNSVVWKKKELSVHMHTLYKQSHIKSHLI